MKGVFRGIKIRFLRRIHNLNLGLYDDMSAFHSHTHCSSGQHACLAFCRSGSSQVLLWHSDISMGLGTSPCSYSAPLIVWTWTGYWTSLLLGLLVWNSVYFESLLKMKWDSKCPAHCWLHSGYSENRGDVVFPLMDGELHLHTDNLGLQPDSMCPFFLGIVNKENALR